MITLGQVPFGKSLSGFSNISNGNDYGNEKLKDIQEGNSSLFNQMQGAFGGEKGYIRIDANELNKYDIDGHGMDNIPDMPLISSRNNSFQQMLRSNPTPALFRGSSSIIDPKILRK